MIMRLGSFVPDFVKKQGFRDWVVIVLGVLIFLTLLSIDSGIDRNYDSDLRSRAASCRLQLADGVPLRGNCLDDALVEGGYFDPNEKFISNEMRATCDIARQIRSIQVPEGCPSG